MNLKPKRENTALELKRRMPQNRSIGWQFNKMVHVELIINSNTSKPI